MRAASAFFMASSLPLVKATCRLNPQFGDTETFDGGEIGGYRMSRERNDFLMNRIDQPFGLRKEKFLK